MVASRTRRTLVTLVAILALGAAACSSGDDSSSTSSSASSGKSASSASQDELKQWQADLDAVGCWAGAVDGIDGPKTEAAIKEFQEAEGLTVDGLLGPATESALSKAAEEGRQVCTGGGTTTSTKKSSTTQPADCPPNCAPNLSVEPTSGPAGTQVVLDTAGDECTGDVEWAVNDPDRTADIPASEWSPGAGSNTLEFTIPEDTPAGTYTFEASCGAEASFTVTK